MDGAPIIDGAVRIEGERIVDVGSASRFEGTPEQVVELRDCILLPGLINTHCHLDYTCLRGRIPPSRSFTDWIRAINAEKAKLSPGDYLRSIATGLAEAQRFGTTAIMNLEAFPELIARAPATPLRIWWCPELIDVSAPQRTEQIIAAALESLPTENGNGGSGLAPHALFTASAELFRRCQRLAETDEFLLTTHLAESGEEMEMFRDASGPLLEFLRALGRPESDCGNGTPLQRFLDIARDPSTPLRSARDDRARRWIVAHLNELAETDFELLRELPDKLSVVHCPRSHAYFGHSPFAFTKLRALGFNICLGTDSLASNNDLSLFAEMREFRRTHSQLSAEEILKMVTLNPAQALGRGTELGRIAPGYLADIIAVPKAGSADVYNDIMAFDDEVRWMMINGEII